MIPSLSRSVHYILGPGFKNTGEHRAATISGVWGGDKPATEETAVHLHVMMNSRHDPEYQEDKGGFVVVPIVKQDPHCKMPDSWHMPERANEAPVEASALPFEPDKLAKASKSPRELVHA